MLLLSPPMPPRIRVVIAARKRGMSTQTIAKGLGISHQAVSQLLEKARRKWAVSVPGEVPRRVSHRARHQWHCVVCSKSSWATKTEAARRRFCSTECMTQHIMPRVRQVVDMRLAGQTWKGIGKAMGYSYQTLQASLWVALHRQGLLTRKVVDDLWRPAPGLLRRGYATRWVENNTGLSPTN